MREESGMPPPWDPSQLESELFQVLDDLDSKLAQEQSAGSVNTRGPFGYGSRTQFKPHYSRNGHGQTMGRRQNCHSDTSNMSIYDILRPGTPREGFKTFSSRTKTIYDMYRTREPSVLKEDIVQKNRFGSTSLCFDSRQRSALPATGRFTARSLHFPAAMQNKNSFAPVRHQQSPKRTPLSSITWNRSDSSRQRQNQEESLWAPSAMDIDFADQYVAPKCFRESRKYELYHSQSAYLSIPFDAPIDNAMSPETLENSENMPFYHQNNPFARSFFTFRQSGEQRFGQNSFCSQHEERSFWSDLHQSRKPFPSDRDFEMISVEANRSPSVYSHNVPFQHWRPHFPGCGTYVFRGQEDPHWWRSNLQTSPLENMDISHVNENQFPPHFVTQDDVSMTDSSCHIQSSGLDYQQGHCPIDTGVEEPHLFGKAQTPVSSFRASFPLIPNNRKDSQSPSFQNNTVNLEKIISHKPDSLPIRNCTEVTVADSHSTESPSFTETQFNTPDAEMHSEKDMNQSISEDEPLNKMDQINKASELPQTISHTVVAKYLPDFQNAHSQDSTQNDGSGFNKSATISSRRSPRVFSREDTSQMLTTQRDKAKARNKDKGFPGNRKPDSAASLPLIQEHGTLQHLPSPNQGCHQKTGRKEDRSNIIKNNHWCFEPTTAEKAESPEEPAALGYEPLQCPSMHSTNGSKLAARHSVTQDSLEVSPGAPQDSSPLSDSFFDALLVPSTTMFSRRLSDQDPSQEEREEKDKALENQNNQLTVNSTDNQESPEGPALLHDGVHCPPYSPFRNGRGDGRVRRRVSCIEQLTKAENRAAATSEGGGLTEDRSGVKAPELSTIYCTLPRKPSSFLIHSKQQESTIMAASVRNGPLPFQIKNKVDVLTGKSTPDKPKSMSDASNSIMGMPEATKKRTDMKAIRSASVRKGPLPFLIKRAVSCPSGEPSTLAESDERDKSPVPDLDASSVTPRPWRRIFSSLEGDVAFKESTFSKRHNQAELAHERTGKDDETPAPGMSSFTPSDGSPKPLCADTSGKESGKALCKFKTTSTFSVSGDEENVKCLEVVSIYYTLPRKPSKKFCSLLQQYAQSTDSLRDAFQGETKALPNALESDKLNCPSQVQSGAPLPQDLKMEVDSALHCLSHSPENKAVSQLPNKEAYKSTLEEIASVEPDVSLHKGELKIKEISPGSLAKTAIDDSLSKKKRGRKLPRQILQSSLLPQEERAGEENTKNHQQPSKRGGGGPSGLPAQSEDNAEHSQTRRSSGACASGIATISTGNGRYPCREHMAGAVDDRSSVSQPRVATGTTGSDCQNLTDKMLPDSESHAFALTPALHKLLLAEEAQSGEADLQSETRRAGSQETNTSEMKKVKNDPQKLTQDQTLLPGGNNESKIITGDLETKKNRYSIKHSLAAMSKASRKVPAKDLSPRRHIATVFSQSESKSGFRGLSLCRSEDSPEPAVKSTESTDKSSLMTVNKSETPLQATTTSSPEPPCQSCNQRSANISQHQNESYSVLATPSESEHPKTQISGESGTLAQLTLTNPIEKSTNYQQKLSLPFPPKSEEKSTINLSHCLLRHGSAPSPESEPEPHLYRSKSLKNFNVHGDWLCTSHPPKARGRHCSENTSIDTALRQLSLDDEPSHKSAYSRRFKSFSELPASDESESWALCHNRTRWGPKSTSSISRPIDYGIFGKEQQLAFLENVKRSLTQGRLWKPSFLKNPGFLKDDVLHASNLSQSELVNSGGRSPEDGLFPSEPLNIYEEEPVDSDRDTDTTTDDEYYLDENDKESEL